MPMKPAAEEFNAQLGSLIKAQRRALKMSQAELAERLDLSRNSVVNIEAGRQSVSAFQFALICTELGTDPTMMLPVPRTTTSTEMSVRDGRAAEFYTKLMERKRLDEHGYRE